MIETLAYIFAVPGFLVFFFAGMILVSHLLDAKAARDHKRKMEEAKDRNLYRPTWWTPEDK